MSEAKKKAFPKLKKSLKNFLTDESGKITKKDALGISAGAALFAGIESLDAASSYSTSINPTTNFYPTDANAYGIPNHSNTVSKEYVELTPNTCNHASGIVNGHFSSVPSVDSSLQVYEAQKTHGSHGSHCSW